MAGEFDTFSVAYPKRVYPCTTFPTDVNLYKASGIFGNKCHFKGDVYFAGSTYKRVSDGTTIDGAASFNGSNISEIGNNCSIKAAYFRGAPTLSIGDNYTGDLLDLSGNTTMTRLGKNLKVGTLIVTDECALRDIPADAVIDTLVVGKDIRSQLIVKGDTKNMKTIDAETFFIQEHARKYNYTVEVTSFSTNIGRQSVETRKQKERFTAGSLNTLTV